MKKFVERFSGAKPRKSAPAETWHNGGDIEIDLYTRSLQRAASTVVAKLAVDEKVRNDWDVGPIVLLYRQALELRLKAVVGEGSNFLKITNRSDFAVSDSLPSLAGANRLANHQEGRMGDRFYLRRSS